MSKAILEAAENIKGLKIQGARNVAIAAIEAIQTFAKETRAKERAQLILELSEARQTLFSSRATEPLMRNAIRYIISKVEKSREQKPRALARIINSASEEFLRNLEESRENIARVGARRICDDSVVLTHCHSSTVTHLLKRAKDQGKNFEVICTETRPLMQGRTTVKEMLQLGVKTTLIVDSAARFLMNQADLVVVGADAITSEGNVVNKIGTSTVAVVAHESRTPFYVVSELLKFDPATTYGDYEKIEERSHSEIWNNPPKALRIRNPAFEVTRRDFIHGVICEEGIIPPHSAMEAVRRRYPWIFEQTSL